MPQRGELALWVLRYILPIIASLPDPTLLNHSSDLWSKRGKKFWSHPVCVQRPFSICRGRRSWKMHLLMKCIPMSCLKQLRLLHLKEHFTLHCNYHSWRGSMPFAEFVGWKQKGEKELSLFVCLRAHVGSSGSKFSPFPFLLQWFL